MTTQQLRLTVNGQVFEGAVPSHLTLLRWLRETANALEVKDGCREGACGACTVQVDARSVASCTVLAAQVNGASVTTSVGLTNEDGSFGSLQSAFLRHGAAQCGFCTQGMLIVADELLSREPSPTRDEIREAIHGNLCRCTGYNAIVDAIEDASREVLA